MRAEELGLDTGSSPTTSSPGATRVATPFSLAWMTAVGERTERVLIGTSVLTPTFRYHPAVIAQAFATMACLTRAG